VKKSKAQHRKALLEKLKDGDEKAKAEFIDINLPLVYSILKKFRPTIPFSSPLHEEFVQEGIIGLITAVDKFNHKMGTQFSTYATFWIRQAFESFYVKQGGIVKKPSNYKSMVKQVLKYCKLYNNDLEKVSKRTGFDIKKISNLLELHKSYVSFDYSFRDEDGQEANCFLTDLLQSSEQTEHLAVHSHMCDELKEILLPIVENLRLREKQALNLRFGLDGRQPKTLREAGNELNLSPERIRQLEERALKKLRNNEELNAYFGGI